MTKAFQCFLESVSVMAKWLTFPFFNPNTAVFGTFVVDLFLSNQQAVMIQFSTLHMAKMTKNLGLSHCPGEAAGGYSDSGVEPAPRVR